MANARRIQRLENVILQTVGPLISHGLNDPRLEMVTVTRIRLSADLSKARVNWSCLGGDGNRSKATHALEHARGHLQSAVARALQTRTTPRLDFYYDAGLEHSVRVNAILDRLARERAEREGEPAEGAEPDDTEQA